MPYISTVITSLYPEGIGIAESVGLATTCTVRHATYQHKKKGKKNNGTIAELSLCS